MADVQQEEQRKGCQSCLRGTGKILRKNVMGLSMVGGVLCGVILGFVLRAAKSTPYTPREAMYVGFLGEIFMHMLKCVAQPLMVVCLISAIGSLDIKLSGKLGGQFIAYMLVTKVFAIAYGILVTTFIEPGHYGSREGSGNSMSNVAKKITVVDEVFDLFRNLIPENLVSMSFETYETLLVEPENATIAAENDYESWDMVRGGHMTHGINIMGLISGSVSIGIAIGVLNARGKNMKLLLAVNAGAVNCLMYITFWIIYIAPFMVAWLVAEQIIRMSSIEALLSRIGMYLVTILGLYLSVIFIIDPLIYLVGVRKNPYKLLGHYADAMLVAWGTGSSLATLPTSIRCLEENAKMDSRLVRFLIPIAHNLNKDGEAIFQGVAPVLIAQMNGLTLTASNYMIIMLMGVCASMASAAIPSSAIVVVVMVLDAIGYPKNDLGLLFAVDWMVDRTSTVTNCVGDVIMASILGHYNKDFLAQTALPAGESDVN